MRKWSVGLLLGFAFAFVLGGTSQAQAQRNPYEFNAHVGAYRYDLGLGLDNDSSAENTDTDVMLGARFGLTYPSGWGFGGNFDWVLADKVKLPAGSANEDINFNLFLYSGEISYTFPATSQMRFFVNAGAGAQTLTVDDEPGLDIKSETNLLIPVGGGLKWMNSATAPRWALRGDVRDNIVFGDDAEGNTETDQNFEFSGGVSLIF